MRPVRFEQPMLGERLASRLHQAVKFLQQMTSLISGLFRIDRMQLMASQTPNPKIQLPDSDDGNSVVLERRTQKTQPPQMHQVVMLNDDFTPMEFVVMVLQEFFSKDREQATQIMLKIHLDGKGVCGVYSKDVAATKVDQVAEAAKKHGHPLQCLSEPLD
jgi:ATP-dependent Clp protease adaptor protein ClpS